MNFEIIKVSDRPELNIKAAKWFSDKWPLDFEFYLSSINESLKDCTVPEWYLVINDGNIIGGMGVIEKDFHNRPDLTPNICAVYVEEPFRGQGIAGKLLRFVTEDMKSKGIDTLYLITEHDSFYERYGWEYLFNVDGIHGEKTRMYIHKA